MHTLLLLALACGQPEPKSEPPVSGDADGDGFLSLDAGGDDCDDTNPDVYPDAPEVCDGLDDDCDGEVDEDAVDAAHWYDDADGDGYGDPDTAQWTCQPAEGAVQDHGDCDDTDPQVNPDAEEVCGDGIDNDCAGGSARCPTWGTLRPDDAVARYMGSAPGDLAGTTAGLAGDLDGDGQPELWISAPKVDAGATDGGATYVLSADLRGEVALDTLPTVILAEHSAETPVGSRLGDTNGDGYDDLLVGVSGGLNSESEQTGAVAVFLGPVTGASSVSLADAYLEGQFADDLAGISVADAGDVNGDGWPDLVAGAPGSDQRGVDAGLAYLVLGPTTQRYNLYWADARMRAEEPGYGLGSEVDGAGDVNGDGFDDVIVGSVLESWLFFGPLSGIVDTEVAGVSYMGTHCAGVGDTDGDGYADVLIGRPDGGVADWALLFKGSPDGADPDHPSATFAPEDDQGGGASAVASAGDLDGDGLSDLLIGGDSLQDVGGAWAFLGPISGQHGLEEADLRVLGVEVGGGLGASVGEGGEGAVLVGGDGLSGTGGGLLFVP